MKTIRNISVIDRRSMILDSLPSDTNFTKDDIKAAIRKSGVVSRAGITDYLTIHLKSYIEEERDGKYRLKG